MLPDYPKLKNKLHDLFILGIHFELMHYSPIFGMINKHVIREGKQHSITQEDKKRITQMKKMSANLEFKYEEIPRLSLREVYERYQTVALEISMQQTHQMQTEICKAVDEVGNLVNAKGKPLSPQLFFQLIEKMHIDFNDDGTVRWPTFVGNEKMTEKFKQVLIELEKEPYKSKMEMIIEKKRIEYNDRESNRKLVD